LSSEKVGIPTATEFMEHKGINDDGTLVSDDKLLSLGNLSMWQLVLHLNQILWLCRTVVH